MEEGVEEMDEEMDKEMDEEEWRAPTSRGRPESIMWDMMLSGPLRLLERREKWMKIEEDVDPLQVAVDRKASCKTWCFPAHRDSSGMYYNKLVQVLDLIHKYKYCPAQCL